MEELIDMKRLSSQSDLTTCSTFTCLIWNQSSSQGKPYLTTIQNIAFKILSYEYHTVSPNGVTLKHAVVQSHYQNNLVMFVVPELMLNVELKDIKMIEWRTSRGMEYSLELVDVISRVCNARMLKGNTLFSFQ